MWCLDVILESIFFIWGRMNCSVGLFWIQLGVYTALRFPLSSIVLYRLGCAWLGCLKIIAKHFILFLIKLTGLEDDVFIVICAGQNSLLAVRQKSSRGGCGGCYSCHGQYGWFSLVSALLLEILNYSTISEAAGGTVVVARQEGNTV